MLLSHLKKKKIVFSICSTLIGYFLGLNLVEPCQKSLFLRVQPDQEFSITKGVTNISLSNHFKQGNAFNIYVGKKFLVLFYTFINNQI